MSAISDRTARIVIVVAIAIHVTAFVLTLRDVEPIRTEFYSLAWWTYIFFLAGVNHLRGRNSLMLDHPREGAWVFFYSALVWFFFEIYNFRTENWAYVGIPIETYLRWPGYFIAYGTVLPGILETETLFRNLGVIRRLRARPLRVTRPLLLRLELLGALMMIAVLIQPAVFFPLVWLGLIFLLDPILYAGNRDTALLGQAEQGNYALAARLVFAGLVCGFLWEFWNHWASAQWIYTLPHFTFLKIFEMPLLGYLGFPPFAMECYLLYQAFVLFRERFVYGRTLAPLAAALVAILYSALAILGIDRYTIITYKVMDF